MPPRKKAKKSESESEEPSEFEPSASEGSAGSTGGGASDASDDSDFGGSKRKKPTAAAAAKKKPAAAATAAAPKAGAKKKISAVAAPKRKAPAAKAEAAAVDGSEEGEGGHEDEQPKKKRAPAKKKDFQPKADDPWSYEGRNLIWRDFGGTQPGEKIAAFDLDGTLINTASGRQFAANSTDWKFYNKHVVKKVKEYADDGYKIVIFSNQGQIKSAVDLKAADNVKKRVEAVVEQLDVPVQVFLAPQNDQYRKPETGMWRYMVENCNGGVTPSLSESFFVGDAAGRPADAATGSIKDFSDSDKAFAQAVGISFKLPDDEFGAMEGKRALDAGARAAARETLAAGEGPNAQLLSALSTYADECFDTAKTSGDDKYKWKATAMKKAVTSLATFSDPITLDSLKAVLKLPGVGKGTVDKIKEYLTTGKVELGAADPEAAAKREAIAKEGNKRQEAAIAFL